MEQHDYIVLLEKFFKKEASSEERRILIEWIRKPGIRNEFNLLCEQMWKEAAVEIDKTVEEEMWNHLQRNLDEPKILSPKKRRWQPIIYKVAATILLPVCLGLATYFGVEHMNKVSQDPFMVAVDYGQKANLTLPDGTKVWLNSATHLSYDAEYNKSDRKIYLDGEAYFEVAPDKNRPFYVETEEVKIRVLGTVFDVNTHYTRGVRTVLVEGAVALEWGDQKEIRMKPGELADFDRTTTEVTLKEVDVTSYISWKEGYFVFEDEPLEEIMHTLSLWYDKEFLFVGKRSRTLHFSGHIKRYERIETILSAITDVTGVEFRMNGQIILIR